jgi:hypothetical protein
LRAPDAADTDVQDAYWGVEGQAFEVEGDVVFGGAADLGREALTMEHRESNGLHVFHFVNFRY